ncbi:copper oxidase [Mycobacterium sp. 852002-53434_SCH5985345]|uniref:multicopper oxidase family protein n=1 Tax=unclassified Mycobacterium TaxID=2642494 RepID=UPI000801D136|nr:MULTISPECIES: multicopper oxidase domain-containing protein [unclassified Mycobacterium]OBF49602.1 copper oxidase [Mycobacterium sp. 852002-53434_SCH5985345]OBG00138.1 copper oxidase [Mycobacterium sp. 852014-52450_SCH5900713]
MNRRSALRLGAAAAGISVVGASWPMSHALLGSAESGRLIRSEPKLPAPYQVPLPIPEQLTPVSTDAHTDYYEITQQVTQLRILPEMTTAAWTYNTSFPGPTIASRTGRRTVVRHRNGLPVPVVVHLHGGHTPPDHDGYPTDFILPQGQPAAMDMARNSVVGQREYVYPMDQRAATLWYHDHRMGYTGAAVWRGLAGFHLVHDDEEDALPLPRGSRDIPLMITDRAFAADGSFRYPAAESGGVTGDYMNGVLGDVILVNGAPWPVLQTDPARYRLRLLNASNARRYRLQLDPQPPGGSALVQIGSDGGLLARPVSHDFIDIAPAERFEVAVDFGRYQSGTRVRLLNLLGAGSAAEVMRFDIVGTDRADDSAIPDRLSTSAPLSREQVVGTRTFLFRLGRRGVWTINDLPYEPGRPLARPRIGTTEIWRFITEFHHPVHVHLNSFQVLSRNNRAPGRFDMGWKDTVDVRPAEAVEVLTRFTDYAGSYLLHCHNLEHEDMAMMADFLTIA